MILRFLFASFISLGCLLRLEAEPPAPACGPVLVRPWTGFEAAEASRYLVNLAFSVREIPDTEVVVVATDDRIRAQEIGISTRTQALIRIKEMGRSPGHQRLYRFMRNPGGMNSIDRGMTDAGCLFPSSAPLP